jgi:ribonuclease HI
VTIIVDASHCSSTLAGGYGFWLASQRGCCSGGGAFKGSIPHSRCAEMCAIVNAFHSGVSQGRILPGDDVLIQSDCLSAIDFLQTSSPTKGHSLEVEAAKLFRSIMSTGGVQVRFRHVKGHTSTRDRRSKSQDICDHVAKKHMREARAKILAAKENSSCQHV